MPFKHEVIDSKGHIHKRLSANRQYPFAVVRHYASSVWDGREYPAHTCCGWASRMDLAQKEIARWAKSDSYESGEIIPCTPIATGRHANLPA